MRRRIFEYGRIVGVGRFRVNWAELAGERILQLLEREHAVVWPEVDAKLAEGAVDLGPRTVDPHHLVNARNRFLGDGTITLIDQPTRGGSAIAVYHHADTHRRLRAIADAAARKRLLHARYRSWARGTKTGSSLTGTALEAVVHKSLLAAAPAAGYRLQNARAGGFREILGVTLPGPADNGGLLMPMDLQDKPVIVIVEAKNLREWVYPTTMELYQLLAKASFVQTELPDWRVVPVFVCRRLHYLTREMGAELGFYPIETRRQYIEPGRSEKELAEVRNELGYNLEPSAAANDQMIRHFSQLIPAAATEVAARWRRTALPTAHLLDRLWRTTNVRRRWPLLEEFAARTRELVAADEVRVWRRVEDDEATEFVPEEY